MKFKPAFSTFVFIGIALGFVLLVFSTPLFLPVSYTSPAASFAAALFLPKKSSVMAWLYPDTPNCSAPLEYRAHTDIDVLKPEYFTLAEDGSLVLLTEAAYGCGGFSLAAVIDIRAHSKEQFATVSGNTETMRAMLTSRVQRAEALAALVHFTEDTGFTGIEIDFEGFGAWDEPLYESYRSFLNELGTRLHARDKKLMVDLPPIGSSREQSYYLLTYKDMAALPIDYLVIMAYDYQYDYGAGSAIAPNAWVKNIIRSARRDIQNLDRIVIGIPSYAYQGVTGSYAIQRSSGRELAAIPGFITARYDTKSFEWMWTRKGVSYVYIDSKGLAAKRALIESMGIRHISVWSLGENAWFPSEPD